MTKPTLYINIDGPLLIPGKNPDPYLNAEVAPYAKAFLHWATQHFEPRLLTDRGPRDGFYLTDKLSLPADKIPVQSFLDSKVEVIERQGKHDFFWVDAELIPHEVSWLAQHGHVNRFVSVDPVKGVTPEHKTVLEGFIRNR